MSDAHDPSKPLSPGPDSTYIPPPPSHRPLDTTPPPTSQPTPPPTIQPLAQTAPVYSRGAAHHTGKVRPFWGLIDVFLSVPFIGGIAILASFIAWAVYSLTNQGPMPTQVELIPASVMVFGGVAQQTAQFAWPWLVSRLKGLGMASDWKFKFEFPKDLGIGVALAFAAVILSSLISASVAALLGIDPNESSNTSILTDNSDSPWLIGIIAMVVIGAPLTEELLFRGLILRCTEKNFGTTAGVVFSTVAFTVIHIQPNASLQETLVLYSTIAVVGAIFGVATVKYDRLGPAIIGHFLFNTFGTVVSLSGFAPS